MFYHLIITMMNERQIFITKKIIESNCPISLEEIKEMTKVSVRTVKYDIKIIKSFLNENNVELQNKRNKGYFINAIDKIHIYDKNILKFDNFDDLLRRNILFEICLKLRKPNLKNIASSLNYSNSNIRNFITKKCKNIILENKVYKVNLPEQELRIFLVENLFDETFNNKKIDNRILELLPSNFLENLYDNIKFLVKKHKVWISENTLIKLMNYLIISKIRIDKGFYIKDNFSNSEEFFKELKFTQEVYENFLDKIFNMNEVSFLNHFLILKGTFVEDEKIENGNKFKKTIKKMLDFLVFECKNFNFNFETLKIDLYRHLSQFLKKYKIGFLEGDLLIVERIINDYYDYYKISEKMIKIFNEEYKIKENKYETGLLAIYLYKNRIITNDRKYNIITVCATGRGLSLLLKTRIENVFNNIKVLYSISSFYLINSSNLKDVDFIVSTIPLPNVNKKVINVSPFLGRSDIRKIDDYLNYGIVSSDIPVELIENNKYKNQNSKIAFDISKIFLKLYDCLLDLPKNYLFNNEMFLGLILHLIISLPRLIEQEHVLVDSNLITEINKIENEYPKLALAVNKFFKYIEQLLKIHIDQSEKYAFYQYLIRGGKNEKES